MHLQSFSSLALYALYHTRHMRANECFRQLSRLTRLLATATLILVLATSSTGQICHVGKGEKCADVNKKCSPVTMGTGNTGKCDTACECVGKSSGYQLTVSALDTPTALPNRAQVSIVPSNYSGTISLSCSVSGGPPTPGCNVLPPTVTVPSGIQSATLTLTPNSSAPFGNYTATVTAIDGSRVGPSNGAQAVSFQIQPGHVDQAMASPVFVNLYWDATWDADNPTMKASAIDAFTQAVVDSSYFKSLSEYGVTGASFGGGFLPDATCASQPPAPVGFYDPFNISIAGFIQCEHDHGPALLRTSNVVYNVILPPKSIENDSWTAGLDKFCVPGGNAGWHYHGLQGTLPPFSGSPVYTINMSNPGCGGNPGLISTLFHEMAEAATDPFPVDISIIPPHIGLSNEDEIADLCEDHDVPVFTDTASLTPLSTPLSVPTYWSNALKRCLSFADVTAPTINNVAISSWGSQTAMTISGNGFGVIPPPPAITLPTSTLSYVTLEGPRWEAGNLINSDTFSLVIPGWSATNVSNIGFANTQNAAPNTVPGAVLSVWLCNPNSLRCAKSAGTAAPGPYNPRLTVWNSVTGDFPSTDTITISQATQQIQSNNVQGSCQPCAFSSLQSFAPGTYNFTQAVKGNVALSRVSNGCQSVTLAAAEETSCHINDQAAVLHACPRPTHCCGEVVNGVCQGGCTSRACN